MNAPAQPIKFHRFTLSGHSHRAELFLSLLGLPVEPIDVDLAGGEQKSPAYLAMNSFGQVPVIQDGDVTVADSNAILVYLASRYGSETWLPRDPAGAAQVQRWLSVAAGQVAYGPCAARLVTVFKATFNPDEVIARAHALFAIMEKELAASPFLVGEHATIADVANYTYIAHAPEGNVSLDAYPAIRAWLARVEALPGFVPMPKTAIGLAA
ncbi:glutathione S-transferase [Zoogloea oleivorans]|uniref:Glutathione S-transferase n=1 Tax=Zoogloea oleivorans TaxID=1552750 RepID=A0A6C2D5E8_9RHOO|nr:glutathione S-transferase [Zoogloea oleivorans]TYC61186.1 glutathione S-transferase [Zoogloea oleivorans]